ncbi:MAG: MBL fold metallo-hydrolase [Candidatus Schekmanbacteria bacterium]|nr:MBL fold metallo-hydrolase [Candidatus Schekmanbacteria bacterium]
MIVHHLNCGTLCPLSARLVTGTGSYFERGRMVCHCLLIETNAGLVLVDTGIGRDDVAMAHPFGRFFEVLAKPALDPDETAWQQIRGLGFRAEDVRHAVVTHLDIDHAGGLRDFPEALVHVHARELGAARARSGPADRLRYAPRQWQNGVTFQAYDEEGEPWHGFQAVRPLRGLPEDILLVPLTGHSRGHSGVAVRSEKGWLLHCGDSYFFHGQLDPLAPWCPPGLRLMQWLDQSSGVDRRRNVSRLRQLVAERGDLVRLFSSHDATELERCRLAAPRQREPVPVSL